MRAVVYAEAGGPPVLAEVPPPECPPDGAIVDVRATGVCRSDWHAWRGHDPVPLPHTPGHEFAGVVSAVGPSVRGFAVGDRVTSPFVQGCGRCSWCRSGDAQVCPAQRQPGFTYPGSFADQVAIHAADTNLVRLPSSLDFVPAAVLGCRFATAFRALTTQARVMPGETVAVFGCGGVGLSVVMTAIALGARVIAVDPSPAARGRAAELGADVAPASFALLPQRHREGPALDPAVPQGEQSGSAPSRAPGVVPHREQSKGATEVLLEGVDVTIDAVGSAATAGAAVRALRPRGRHVQIGLMLGDDARAPLPWDLVIARELQIFGSHGMAARDYPAMLEMVADGRLDPAALVSRVIGLDEAGAALAAMDDPAPGITVVTLS